TARDDARGQIRARQVGRASLDRVQRPAGVVTMSEHWIADRARGIEMSGVRKIFELGRSLKDPVNLSIGQPHFAVPESVRAAAHAAIDAGCNGYTVTQGIPELRAKIKARLDREYGHADREVIITSGTSGGLLLALL